MKTAPIKEQGVFNWADCATTDLPAAEKFYSAVFGWKPERIVGSDGNTYSIQRLNGKMVCGIYVLNEEMRSMGVPPHWGCYVEVRDIAETLDVVKAAGGSVLEEPFEEPGVATIAIIQDPTGAYLRMWHSANEHGAEVYGVAGSMVWHELTTDDPAKAAHFYETALGIKIETTETPMPYSTLMVHDHPVAGIFKLTPEMVGVPSSWNVYFGTDDVDATARKVQAVGGILIREPFDIPGVGRMAVIQDPQGAVFQVMKMNLPMG